VAVVIAVAGSGYRSIFGPLKGSDFVQFYTLGHIDRNTAATVLYDEPAFHRLQTALVPESDPEHYLVVYPPHAAILFRPLARLSYGQAALVWATLLAGGYALSIWLAWRPVRAVLPDARLLVAAAAAFPPFWFLVLHGQTTVVPLLAFSLGWVALRSGRSFWAGVAFGLLLLKPQFALVLPPLVLVCAEWSMLAGAVASVVCQIAITIAAFGPSVLGQYVALMTHAGDIIGDPFLEAKQEQMHSLSVLTNHLPSPWSALVWASLAGLVVWKTIHVWRSAAPLNVRMAFLVLGSTLVNPHVFVYDATVLALPLVWFAAWIFADGSGDDASRASFTLMVYVLFVSLLAPSGRFVPVQVSVVCLGWMFVAMLRDVNRAAAPTT
jgi:hypothetical protein